MIYLSLGEVLAVVGTLRNADVVELALELREVALSKGKTQLQSLVRVRRADEGEPARGAGTGLVELEVAGGGLAQGKGYERSEEQAGGNHCDLRRPGREVEEDLGYSAVTS